MFRMQITFIREKETGCLTASSPKPHSRQRFVRQEASHYLQTPETENRKTKHPSRPTSKRDRNGCRLGGQNGRGHLLFFQRLLISSNVLPFVSGTSFQTNTAARIQMTPYRPYANMCPNFSPISPALML